MKEVQAAVARGDADAAVHSAKDLPASELAGLADCTWPRSPSARTPATRWSVRTLDDLADRRDRWPPVRPVAARNWPISDPTFIFADLRGNLATRLAPAGTGGSLRWWSRRRPSTVSAGCRQRAWRPRSSAPK